MKHPATQLALNVPFLCLLPIHWTLFEIFKMCGPACLALSCWICIVLGFISPDSLSGKYQVFRCDFGLFGLPLCQLWLFSWLRRMRLSRVTVLDPMGPVGLSSPPEVTMAAVCWMCRSPSACQSCAALYYSVVLCCAPVCRLPVICTTICSHDRARTLALFAWFKRF